MTWNHLADKGRWLSLDESFALEGQASKVVPLPVSPKEIRFMETFGFLVTRTDECWLYNVLQHVDDPHRVVEVAKRAAKVLRVFEWINIPGDEMHPHVPTQELLEEWYGPGTVEANIDHWNGANQDNWAFYGVFDA